MELYRLLPRSALLAVFKLEKRRGNNREVERPRFEEEQFLIKLQTRCEDYLAMRRKIKEMKESWKQIHEGEMASSVRRKNVQENSCVQNP